MDVEELRSKAHAFIACIPAGKFPEGLMADEFKAWTAFSGDVERGEYLRRVGVIGNVFGPGGLNFTFDRSIAEGKAVSLQVRGRGTLFTGENYTQSYLFVVEFNDKGQVRHVREYIDTHIVHTMLAPAMQRWAREHPAG